MNTQANTQQAVGTITLEDNPVTKAVAEETEARRVGALALELPDTSQLSKELSLIVPASIAVDEEVDPKVEKMANDFVASVISFDPSDASQVALRQQHVSSVENIGKNTVKEASHKSAMLDAPIRKLAAKGEDGGDVANALAQLKDEVEALDPPEFDITNAGFLTRMMGHLPFVGSNLKRYFTQFESAQTVIDAIMISLEKGGKMLARDNTILLQDQSEMRVLTIRLEDTIKMGMLIDQKFEYALERTVEEGPKSEFIQTEILFPLRQSIQGLQKMLAVNQQGVLAIEIIIRNNKELIRGVNLTQSVTVNALRVAVVVALALANQKIVLDKITAVNKVTDNLIASTAKKLRTQGVDIQKQAAEGGLKIDTLRQALTDIAGAINDISSYRQQALPLMAKNILELDSLTNDAEQSIRKMEEGNAIAPTIQLEV